MILRSFTAPLLAFTANAAPPFATDWLEKVEPARIKADVATLCGFGTRHTLSKTDDATRGIGAAAAWIERELEGRKGCQTRSESFTLPPSMRLPQGGTVVNVVGVVHGTAGEGNRRAYYVVGHFDSRNADAMDATGDAPGANDNASGSAVVMELARIVALKPLESTVVFLLTSGEEQGLLGAQAHVSQVIATNPYMIRGVLNNDTVGDPTPAPGERGVAAWPPGVETTSQMRAAAEPPDARKVIRLFSEGTARASTAEQRAKLRELSSESDSASRQLARFVDWVATHESLALRPMLVFRPDRFKRGGDHSAFNDGGFAAVRFTTLNEDYSRQHVNVETRAEGAYGDVATFVDEEYMGNVARLNLATLVHLANAPDSPREVRLHTEQLDHRTRLSWLTPEPAGSARGYEVVWRLTTEHQWTGSLDVGSLEDVTLPLSKDNVFFGVRSYDSDRYLSPVTPAR